MWPPSPPTPPLALRPPDEPEVMLDINTTPLIDVMLVLLIMLIITIPIQLHAVHLDAASAATVRDKPKVIAVVIDAQNQMRWNGQVVPDVPALHALLRDAAQSSPQPELHIRADDRSKYHAVAAVLAGARREGLNKIGIVGLRP